MQLFSSHRRLAKICAKMRCMRAAPATDRISQRTPKEISCATSLLTKGQREARKTTDAGREPAHRTTRHPPCRMTRTSHELCDATPFTHRVARGHASRDCIPLFRAFTGLVHFWLCSPCDRAALPGATSDKLEENVPFDVTTQSRGGRSRIQRRWMRRPWLRQVHGSPCRHPREEKG